MSSARAAVAGAGAALAWAAIEPLERRHPASAEPGLAPFWNVRGLAQATVRHALFGIVLGRLVL